MATTTTTTATTSKVKPSSIQMTTNNPPTSACDNNISNRLKNNVSTKTLNNDSNSQSHDSISSESLTATLDNYKYLDDYEFYREERLKHNALRKFGLILQSIKTKHKDCLQLAKFDEDNESDTNEEHISEFSNFDQILKRHRKRYRQSHPSHRRR